MMKINFNIRYILMQIELFYCIRFDFNLHTQYNSNCKFFNLLNFHFHLISWIFPIFHHFSIFAWFSHFISISNSIIVLLENNQQQRHLLQGEKKREGGRHWCCNAKYIFCWRITRERKSWVTFWGRLVMI